MSSIHRFSLPGDIVPSWITEEELLEDCRIAEQERKAGKLKKLKHFADLLKVA